jgi:hypothetical protein
LGWKSLGASLTTRKIAIYLAIVPVVVYFAIGLTAPSIALAADAMAFQFPISPWPTAPGTTGYDFGSAWDPQNCPNPGPLKVHTAIDKFSPAGTNVYAAASGNLYGTFITDRLNPQWGWAALITHNVPGEGFALSQYWHIARPTIQPGVINMGAQLSTLYDIGSSSHIHFGIQQGGSVDTQNSWAGALPTTDCGGYPKFPWLFTNPTTYVNKHSGPVGRPAVQFQNSVNLFASGTTGTYQSIYQKFSTDTNGNNMSAWSTTLPSPPVSLSSDPVALTFGNSIRIFAIGSGGQGLYQTYSVGSGWSSWVTHPAPTGVRLEGDPAAVQFQNSVNVFVRGWESATSTSRLYQKFSTDTNGNNMSDWVTIPIPPVSLTGGPVAVPFGNSINLLAIGQGAVLLQIYKDICCAWSGWANLGGPSTSFLVGNPAAVLFNNSSINVFVRSNDGAVRQIYSLSTYPWWSGWGSLGVGPIAYDPAVIQLGSSINVLGIAFDGTLQQQWSLDVAPWWSGWRNVGGNVSGNPAIEQYQGSIKVFAASGTGDGTLQQTWSIDVAPWWNPWVSLGRPTGITIQNYTSTR